MNTITLEVPKLEPRIQHEIDKLYAAHPERNWEEDYGIITKYGKFLHGPDYAIGFYRSEDAWFIHIAVGLNGVRLFPAFMPFYLPFIGWARDNGEVHWYPTEQVFRRLGYGNNEYCR